MKYELAYPRRAERDIKKLDESIKKKLAKILLRYQDDPLRYAEKLINPALGTYRFRIGEYRVIFDMEENRIIVLRIGHSREIYKR